jgi:hemolysin D
MKEDKYEFRPILSEIEDTPTSPLGRASLWVIVVAILFFSLWLYFGRIDVVVTAMGKIIPEGEVKVVQSAEEGVIRKILVKPGDLVEKGQMLLDIDPSVTEKFLESKQINFDALTLQIQRLESLINQTPFNPDSERYSQMRITMEKRTYDSLLASQTSRIQSHLKGLDAIEESRKTLNIELERYQALLKIMREKYKRLENIKDIISKEELEEAYAQLLSHQNSVKSTLSKIAELDQTRTQKQRELEVIKETFRSDLLAQLSALQEKKETLDAEIKSVSFSKTKQQVISPIDGYVKQLLVHTVGGVVSKSQELIHIVPKESTLIAKVYLLSRDKGFVTKGMEASVKMDTYSFQKYGTIKGKVIHISDDSIEHEKMGLVYEVFVGLEDTRLEYKGKEVFIEAGMGLSAEIKIQERRIITFFLYPLMKDLDEGMAVR